MKNAIMITGLLLIAVSSQAASVCVFRSESQGIERKLYIDCSHAGGRQATSLVTRSTDVVDNRTPVAKARVDYIRRLYEMGYKAETDNIFVRQ
jgi:hypothetical protein